MRRRAALAVLTAALLLACLSPASGPPDAPATPEGHVRLAVSHLRIVPHDDRQYARYVSWLAVPRGRLKVAQAVMRWWLNQLSTEQAVARPALVPGSHGLLWQLDLRDYNWNARAWRVVARREPYFREPWVSREAAKLLRLRIEEEPRPDDDGTVHVIGVVRADWLFRETVESARSDSYYDLLYAGKRFEGAREAVDFPKDEKDWNDFFGITLTADFLARQKIDTRRGAVVAGGRDDPVRGSIVARQNRVVQILPVPTGVALKTFDVKKTAGKTDFVEEVPEIAVGKIKFDAGELLASLPNGGQAALLINGAGKRQEFATGEFVHPRGPDTRTPDVRTAMGCVICHAPDGGVIPPRDLFRELLKDGVDLKVKDRALANRIKAFFLEWDDELKSWQRPYLKLIERTTADPYRPGDRGLAPAALAKEFMGFRDWYDDPVTVTQAAAELGYLPAEVRLVASKSVKARLGQLAVGKSIPREAFERDVYREVALLLAARETHP